MFAFIALHAQWVDDPMNNTFIANCASGAGELHVSTDPISGDTYVQWDFQGDNGWSPWLQRLNAEGEPQWSADGIHITTPDFATWSPGYAMTAVEGGVVSVFRTLGPHHWAVKINADGTLPWGEHGIMLFNGEGGGRSEVLAGDDGGVWTLGTDMDNSFLQYVNADGTMRPMATITEPDKKCTNGVLVPANDGVFVVYARQTLQGYTNYNKEIYVAKYNKDGELLIPPTLLMGLQTVGASYIHYAIPDGLGGAYVYQYHNGIGGVYNVYVTHFNENGTPTILDPNGVTVHSTDYNNYYISAYTTVDPVTHDLLLVYRQTDSYSQSQYKIYINRITSVGDKPWGDGILVLDNGTTQCGGLRIDAFEYGEGFSVIYHKAIPNAYEETIEAHGFDMEGNMTWSTRLCANTYPKTGDENTPGFHNGQNIVTWINSQDGGVYGQNIGWDGTMGEVTPPTPPAPCYPPTNFEGFYSMDIQCNWYGAELLWTAPETTPLHYRLYREDLDTGTTEMIEIDAEATDYIDNVGIGSYIYRLTAVYEDCESDYALTPDGEDYLFIEVTSVPEYADENIVTIVKVYNLNGQLLRGNNLDELPTGIYLIQGLTKKGKTVTRKLSVGL